MQVYLTSLLYSVGDEGVGKTALAERLTSGQFCEVRDSVTCFCCYPVMLRRCIPPLQMQFSNIFNSWSHPMVVDARPVVLSVWEPGSSMRPDLRTRSYIGKDVVMFCYKANDERTLRSIREKVMSQIHLQFADF